MGRVGRLTSAPLCVYWVVVMGAGEEPGRPVGEQQPGAPRGVQEGQGHRPQARGGHGAWALHPHPPIQATLRLTDSLVTVAIK